MLLENLKCCGNCKYFDIEYCKVLFKSGIYSFSLCEKWKFDDLNKNERLAFEEIKNSSIGD